MLCGLRSWLLQNEIGEPAKYDIVNVDAHELYCAQKNVGFDSFVQGLLDKAHNFPVKLNGIRWTKYVMISLMEFAHNMWKERCAIVTAGTNETHERRVRGLAWEKLIAVKRDSWKIPSVCRDLLRRDKKFFMTAPFLQIEMWVIRMESALEQGKNSDGIKDIRDYGNTLNETTGSKRVRAKKKYTVDSRKQEQNIFSYISNLRN